MRIVTNPGSNLPREAIARYGVEVLPQQVVVDGVHHDTRDGISHETVDGWVRGAKEHPFVLGTSAAELVEVFRRLSRDDQEILAIMTSRKIIGSHTAAVSAKRTLEGMAGYEKVRVEVIDTKSTDLGAGLCAILAGESALAGRTLAQTTEVVERLAEDGVMMLTLETLDNLVKGGRASFLRAWLADLFNVSPVLSFKDGELAAVAKMKRSADPTSILLDALVAKIGAGRPVWVAIVHGGHPTKAALLLEGLRAKLDVVFALERPLSASIYLHCGPGALGAFVCPIDRLPWKPPVPRFALGKGDA